MPMVSAGVRKEMNRPNSAVAAVRHTLAKHTQSAMELQAECNGRVWRDGPNSCTAPGER